MSQQIGWTFPLLNGGQGTDLDGTSAADTFSGTAMYSLVKETIQNSLDARIAPHKAAHVYYDVFDIPLDSLYGKDDLLYAINATKQKHLDTANERILSFFQSADEALSTDSICIMQISDKHTSGLRNPDVNLDDDEQIKHSRWYKLVHGMGDTDKDGGNGGSHGQGKSAVLCNSALRTVFYSTIDDGGKEGFQGVAYLGTHRNRNGQRTQGVGYYGIQDAENSPILKCHSLNPQYTRSESGTDIFVVGFENRENWAKRVLIAALNDYLVAFWKGELEVQIGDQYYIAQNTLNQIMPIYSAACAELEESVNYADKYYAALMAPDFHEGPSNIELNEEIKGQFELFVKAGLDCPSKTIAMVRQVGMKVYDRRNANSPMQYAGVMYIIGDELNAFLASLENIPHTAWEPNRRGKKAAEANKMLQKLYRKLSDTMHGFVTDAIAGRMEIEGLEEYFGVEVEEDGNNAKSTVRLASKIDKATVKKKKAPAPSAQYNVSAENGSLQRYEENPEELEEGTNPNEEEHEDHSTETHHPHEVSDVPTKEKTDQKNKEGKSDAVGRGKPIQLKNQMLLAGKPNTGEYTLVLQSKKECVVRVTIFLVGEDADERPQITHAEYKNGAGELTVGNGYISNIILPTDKIVKIRIKLKETIRCSWGVQVDAI